jgi:ABC-2 type transport system ATP-binding protein
MSAVIEVSDLHKNYHSKNGQLEAVRGISFAVEQGEIFGILGPNGAGKTTTLEIIEGLRQPSGGSVKVLGLDVVTQAPDVRKRIGVQLQSSEYLEKISLTEQLQLFASLYGKKANVPELLGFVGLQDKAREEVKHLSGGQKQKFTLATALVNRPEVLFLDEPTTGLDPRARHEVWQLVHDINQKGITIIITTHYMEEAEYLCNRVAILDQGKILQIDNPRSLIENLSHTTQVSFFTVDKLDESIWKAIPEVKKVYSNYPKVILEITSLDAIAKVLNVLRERKIKFSGFIVRTATLEDVYLDLTGREFGQDIIES